MPLGRCAATLVSAGAHIDSALSCLAAGLAAPEVQGAWGLLAPDGGDICGDASSNVRSMLGPQAVFARAAALCTHARTSTRRFARRGPYIPIRRRYGHSSPRDPCGRSCSTSLPVAVRVSRGAPAGRTSDVSHGCRIACDVRFVRICPAPHPFLLTQELKNLSKSPHARRARGSDAVAEPQAQPGPRPEPHQSPPDSGASSESA